MSRKPLPLKLAMIVSIASLRDSLAHKNDGFGHYFCLNHCSALGEEPTPKRKALEQKLVIFGAL